MNRNRNTIIKWVLLIVVTLLAEAYFIKGNHLTGDRTLFPQADLDNIKLNKSDIVQTFISPEEHLEGLIIQTAKNDKLYNPSIAVKVVLNCDEIQIGEWNINKYTSSDDYIRLIFDEPLVDVEGSKFELIFQSEEKTGLSLKTASHLSSGAEKLTVNGDTKEDESICYSLIRKKVDSHKLFFIVALFTIIAVGIIYLILNIWENAKPEYIFAVIYSLIGIYSLAAVPLHKVPDSVFHFLRSYQISTGTIVSGCTEEGEAGDYLPSALIEAYPGRFDSEEKLYLIEKMSSEIDPQDQSYFSFPSSAQYAPGTYLPQVIGMKIADLFTDRVMFIAYAGRIMNWLVVGILFFLCIHMTPFAKNLIMLIGLTPMNLYQSASLSADSFALALCISIIVFVLYWRVAPDNRAMSWRALFLMFLLVFLISQSKIIYAAMCMLLFLIPVKRFGSKKKYAAIVLAAIVIALITCGGWFFLIRNYRYVPHVGTNAKAQVLTIIKHPIDFAIAMANTASGLAMIWLQQAFGEVLGVYNIETNLILIILYASLTIWYIVFDNDIKKYASTYDKVFRFVMAVTVAFVMLLLFTSEYVQWTVVGKASIDGVQGRYLLPLFLPVFLTMKPSPDRINNDGMKAYWLYPIVLCINIAIFTITLLWAV